MTRTASRSNRGGLWKLPVLWKTANGRGFPRGPWTPANGAGAHSYHRPLPRRIPSESGQFTCQTRPDRSLVTNREGESAAGRSGDYPVLALQALEGGDAHGPAHVVVGGAVTRAVLD